MPLFVQTEMLSIYMSFTDVFYLLFISSRRCLRSMSMAYRSDEVFLSHSCSSMRSSRSFFILSSSSKSENFLISYSWFVDQIVVGLTLELDAILQLQLSPPLFLCVFLAFLIIAPHLLLLVQLRYFIVDLHSALFVLCQDLPGHAP